MYGIGNIQGGAVQANPVANTRIVAASGVRPSKTVLDGNGDFDSSPPGEGVRAGATDVHPGIHDKVVQAVRLAVSQFDPSGSLSDLRKKVQGAVDDTLKQNGIEHHSMPSTQSHAAVRSAVARGPGLPRRAADDPPPTASAEEVMKHQLIASLLGVEPYPPDPSEAIKPFMVGAPPGSMVDTSA